MEHRCDIFRSFFPPSTWSEPVMLLCDCDFIIYLSTLLMASIDIHEFLLHNGKKETFLGHSDVALDELKSEEGRRLCLFCISHNKRGTFPFASTALMHSARFFFFAASLHLNDWQLEAAVWVGRTSVDSCHLWLKGILKTTHTHTHTPIWSDLRNNTALAVRWVVPSRECFYFLLSSSRNQRSHPPRA